MGLPISCMDFKMNFTKMDKSCLIIDEMHESIVPLLENAGFKVDYRPEITRQALINDIGNYSGLIVRSKTTIDKEVLDVALQLNFVARAGAGLDKLDMNALQERKIKVINAPEGNRDAVAEHTLGLISGLMCKIHKANHEVKNFKWNRSLNRGQELKGKTIGILGYGYMGEAVAKRFKCFGANIIAHDKYKKGFGDEQVREVDEATFFRETEILTIHVPLTNETRGMVSKKYLDNFSQNIFVLNTSRGEVLELTGLIEGLETGKVQGAGLDVLEWENFHKLSRDQRALLEKLFSFQQVVVTPHVAGWTYESYKKINEVLFDKIQALEL